jgi:hypothetical protein
MDLLDAAQRGETRDGIVETYPEWGRIMLVIAWLVVTMTLCSFNQTHLFTPVVNNGIFCTLPNILFDYYGSVCWWCNGRQQTKLPHYSLLNKI